MAQYTKEAEAEFWSMINANNLWEDVVVPVVAEDYMIQYAVKHISNPSIIMSYDAAQVRVKYQETQEHILNKRLGQDFMIPEDKWQSIIVLCKSILAAEAVISEICNGRKA